MSWSVEAAIDEILADLKLKKLNDESRARMKRRLMDIFSAGYRQGFEAAEYNDSGET